jgi:precorrin-3B synthase
VTAAPDIKGWCPSASRPMLTGDGYLVRLHFSGGIVSSDQARCIADLASRYGNGLLDLTRRANLQIRGVAEERIAALQGELLARGLIAANTDGAGAPNVIASPLAGCDPHALIDIRRLVVDLEARLARDPGAKDLPAKFCVSIDDGGRFSLRDVAADVAFEACGRDAFAVRVGGEVIGSVDADQVGDTAAALVAAFVALRATIPVPTRRMRDIVDAVGISQIAAACPWLRAPSAIDARIGGDRPVRAGHAVGFIAEDVLGIAAPFGSLSADQLHALADLAARHGDGELRLTPWRAILVAAVVPGSMSRLQRDCVRAGLIIDPADPRRHIAACSGAPACASASVDTRTLATRLAPLLRPGETLHVSGCAKSCASSAAATFTLVGRNGRFDLVREGKPRDAPTLPGLSPEDAHLAIQRLAAEELADV